MRCPLGHVDERFFGGRGKDVLNQSNIRIEDCSDARYIEGVIVGFRHKGLEIFF